MDSCMFIDSSLSDKIQSNAANTMNQNMKKAITNLVAESCDLVVYFVILLLFSNAYKVTSNTGKVCRYYLFHFSSKELKVTYMALPSLFLG